MDPRLSLFYQQYLVRLLSYRNNFTINQLRDLESWWLLPLTFGYFFDHLGFHLIDIDRSEASQQKS